MSGSVSRQREEHHAVHRTSPAVLVLPGIRQREVLHTRWGAWVDGAFPQVDVLIKVPQPVLVILVFGLVADKQNADCSAVVHPRTPQQGIYRTWDFVFVSPVGAHDDTEAKIRLI
eukprot:scaffold870_cov268-Pinguiococcus_pyrenoidosus.AAC.20